MVVVLRGSAVSETTPGGVRAECAGTRVLASRNRVTRNPEGLLGNTPAAIASFGNDMMAGNSIDLTGVASAPFQ